MDPYPTGPHCGWPFQMDCRALGLFWLVLKRAFGVTSANEDVRIRENSYAWRLRSPEALDGDHQSPSTELLVLLRLTVLGLRLPPLDSLP